MTYGFRTKDFEIEYIESMVSHSALWENHCHARFEMIAVLEGDVSVMVEGGRYRLTKNQTIIIPPLCYHSVTVNKSGAYRRITVLFELSAIPDALRPEFVKNGHDISISFSSNIERLKEVCQKGSSLFYAPLAQSLMIQIFYDTQESTKSQIGSEADEFLQGVISYIDQHLCEKILLDDLARHTSRSKSSFCHLFERKMNISPKQYILQKKLALASKLILEGMPPTIAATHVGYENYSNFYRIYFKHFGRAPTRSEER